MTACQDSFSHKEKMADHDHEGLAATKRSKSNKRKNGRPIRPLSAYNIFFHMERKKVMRDHADQNVKHATGGFGTLARRVSEKWKTVDAALKIELEAMANKDKQRYKHEVEAWKLAMLKEANIAMKESFKTAPTQSHASEAFVEVLATKNAHAVTLHDIKPSPPSQSNSAAYLSGLALPPPPFETPRREQCVIYPPYFSSIEVSSTVNCSSRILGKTHSEVIPHATTPFHINPSPPSSSSLDNQVISDFHSPPEPSKAARWDEFCVPCSSFDQRISTGNSPRLSTRISYCDHYGDIIKDLSPQGQRSSLLNIEDDENLLYMRGYVDGFKAAREMWELQGI